MNILDIVGKIIQAVAPSFKLSVIDKLQFTDKLMLSDNLHININIDLKDVPKATTVIIPREQKVDDESKSESMIIESMIEDVQNITTSKKTAIGTGIHIIVNNPSFWDDEGKFIWKQIEILPYTIGKKLCIETLVGIRKSKFDFFVHSNGEIQVTIWSGAKPEILKFDKTGYTNHSAGSSRWEFKRCTGDDFFYQPKFPEIIVTFDRNIVKDYLLIIREPHDGSMEEYYILVNKN